MLRSVLVLALASASMLAPTTAGAAEKQTISIAIVNERPEVVTAQAVVLENCYPELNVKIAPNGTHHYACTVWDASKFTRVVVRLVLPGEKIACEGHWTPGRHSVPYASHGAKCTIAELGKDRYRFTIR